MLSPSAFYAAPSGVTISKAKRQYGTLITYSDSQAATSTFTVPGASSGSRQGKSCRGPSAANRRGKRCTILTTLGTFTHADTAGVDRLHFSGRLKGRRLAAGRYTLSVAARNAAGRGPAVSRAFTIR